MQKSPPKSQQKSPEAFRTISEVAVDLDVPQHVLRFWETKFTQIKPLKRGGGRRYYRPEDIDLLRGIRTLLYHDGYTIKGVQKVFREQGVRHVTEIGREEYEAEMAEAAAAGIDEVQAVDAPVDDEADVATSDNVSDPGVDAEPSDLRSKVQKHLAPAPLPPMPLSEEQQDELEAILEGLEGLKDRLDTARLMAME